MDIDLACSRIYGWMKLRKLCSGKPASSITEALPGLSLQETRDRFERRHLQNHSRSLDPCTVELQRLALEGQGFRVSGLGFRVRVKV